MFMIAKSCIINANFSKLFFGFTLSKMGSWLRRLAITSLIYFATKNPTMVGISFLITYLPTIFSGALSRVLIEKISTKSLMVYSNLIGFIGSFLLFILLPGNFLIFIILSIVSIADALYEPSRMAFIPQLVDLKSEYVKAVTYIRVSREATMLLSTAVGGVLIGFLGIKIIFLLDALSYLISVFFHVLIRIKNNPDHAIKKSLSIPRNLFINLKNDLLLITNNWQIFFIIILTCGRQLAYGIAVIAFNIIVLGVYHLNVTYLGFSYMVGGLGSIIGGYFLKDLLKLFNSLYKNLVILSSFNAMTLLFMFISPSYFLFLLCVFFHDVNMILLEVTSETSLMSFFNEQNKAKVSSVFFFFSAVFFTIGSLIYTFFISNWSTSNIGYFLFGILILNILISIAISKMLNFKREVLVE